LAALLKGIFRLRPFLLDVAVQQVFKHLEVDLPDVCCHVLLGFFITMDFRNVRSLLETFLGPQIHFFLLGMATFREGFPKEPPAGPLGAAQFFIDLLCIAVFTSQRQGGCLLFRS
jgi:hypothetical protein